MRTIIRVMGSKTFRATTLAIVFVAGLVGVNYIAIRNSKRAAIMVVAATLRATQQGDIKSVRANVMKESDDYRMLTEDKKAARVLAKELRRYGLSGRLASASISASPT